MTRAATRAALLAGDPVAAVASVRLEVRGLVSAIAAALPTADPDDATWADLTEAHAVRGLLAEALRIVVGG